MTERQFEEIFNRYRQDVAKVAFYYLRSKEDAEDVTIDVFADFYCKPPKDLDAPKPYLLKLAANKAVGAFRARPQHIEYDDAKKSIAPNEAETVLQKEDVAKAIRLLPKKLATPIILVYLSGLTQKEAAAAIGCTEMALRKRLERGRKKMQEILQNGV
jgi:RNA polymerase sigma-70 factor (ECF subfamily)